MKPHIQYFPFDDPARTLYAEAFRKAVAPTPSCGDEKDCWICTRQPHHAGPHVAHVSPDEAVASWDKTDPSNSEQQPPATGNSLAEMKHDPVALARFYIARQDAANNVEGVGRFLALAVLERAQQQEPEPTAPRDGDRRQRTTIDPWGNTIRVEERFTCRLEKRFRFRPADGDNTRPGRWELMLRALVAGPWLDEMKVKPGELDPRD